MKQLTYGFGVNPDESQNYFLVRIPSRHTADRHVEIHECFEWTPGQVRHASDKVRLIIPRNRWNKIAPDLTAEFNARLKANKLNPGKFEPVHETVYGRKEMPANTEQNCVYTQKTLHTRKFLTTGTPVEKFLGREMMILLWAIENCDPREIPGAIVNWKGLMPEERWWLYTITNAATGDINDGKRGWRVALRFALCNNPYDDSQLTFNF